MKANTSIIEKESIRFLINLSQLFLGTAFIPQIEFNELCISAKIVVAPKIEIPKLTKAADLEESVFSAFSIIERRASVLQGPQSVVVGHKVDWPNPYGKRHRQ